MSKKLKRSSSDKVIAGVAGGLAQYLDIDSTIVRILWVIVCLAGGAGLLAYIVCWLLMPTR